MNLPESLKNKLDDRRQNKRLRTLIDLDHLIDFYSNDYFGIAKLKFNSDRKQVSTGSRLISGNSLFVEQKEQEFADFFGYESSLLFNSGYDANVGVFSAILEKGDTVIMDNQCHASIRDGSRLSYAKTYTFFHNDIENLESKLKLAIGNIYVVIESIYSMDGDVSPMLEINELCKKYKARLIIDEAHAGGVIGQYGKGYSHLLGIDKDIFIKLITFSKGYGNQGAIILCKHDVKEYLINYARSLIYTSALPENMIERISSSMELVANMDKERIHIDELTKYFIKLTEEKNIPRIESTTHIQSFLIPEISELVNTTQKLRESGFAVRAISVPTVKMGTERIRICLHSYNTKDEIKNLIDSI